MKRFRYLLDPLCLIGCAAYTLNRWALKPIFSADFLHSYFNDCWLIPCALPALLALQRHLGLRRHDGMPTRTEVLSTLVVWSVLFEAVGPRWFAVTGDVLDVVAYGVGAAFAWGYWKRRYGL